VLAVAVHNHYKRIHYESLKRDHFVDILTEGPGMYGTGLQREETDEGHIVELEKSNVLIMGPTGC
ncbi:hypothetical protein KI387_018008, partial [Taxus chinensis]